MKAMPAAYHTQNNFLTNTTMSTHIKKQFGIWMDQQQATIVSREGPGTSPFVVLGKVVDPGPAKNTNEHAANNHEIALRHKYFKEIAAKLLNADEVHVSGTGEIQEQFIKFLAGTPQYKNVRSSESTSIKMDDQQLIAFTAKHFK